MTDFDDEDPKPFKRKERRKPRKPTPQRIRNWAIAYLTTRDATAHHLSELLTRRALRNARVHEIEAEEVKKSVEEVITSLSKAGFLDDNRVAPSKAKFEANRGKSNSYIRHKLMEHGISGDLLEASLETACEEESEEIRAFRYARSRRVGPYAKVPPADRKERDKQMARLARAGFPLDIIRKVMDCAPEDIPDEVPPTFF